MLKTNDLFLAIFRFSKYSGKEYKHVILKRLIHLEKDNSSDN